MQLILSRFLRPKWQHPRADVRRQALAKLNPKQQDDCAILLDLALNDDADEVREAAIARLDNPQQLLQLLQQTEPSKRQTLQQHLVRICSEGDQPVAERLPLLDTITNEADLLSVTLKGNCFKISQEALLRMHDEALLQQVVIEAPERKLRLLAAEAIHSADHLQSLIREVRQKDKQIYRMLKERLDRLRSEEATQQARQQAQLNHCQALEKLANEALFPHYDAKLNALLQQWQTLPGPIEQALASRVDRAVAICQERAQAQIAERTAEQARVQAREEYQTAQQRCHQLAEQLCHPPTSLADAESELEALTQKQAALIPLLDTAVERQLPQRFQADLSLAQSRLACWYRLNEFEDKLSASTTDVQVAELLTKLAWHNDLERPATLLAAEQRLAANKAAKEAKAQQRSAVRQQRLAELQQTLDHLKHLLQEGQLQEAGEPLQQLQRNQKGLSAEQKRQLTLLRSQYQELAGWQTYATQPKLEQLCEQMEQLAGATLPDAERASQLKTLQKSWRELEGPQVPNPLRERFQAANHQAYALCEAYFAAQRTERERNLAQRQALCEQLASLLNNHTTAPIALKKLTAEDRRMRKEWRNYSPVERNAGKKLQKRFNQDLKRLAELIQTAQQEAANQKQTLIDELKTLASQPPCDQPLTGLKALQKRWRGLELAEHKKEAKLWKEFSELADDLYRQVKNAQSSADSEARQAAETLCIAIEQTTETLEASPATLAKQFDELCLAIIDNKRLVRRFERALIGYQLRVHPLEADWLDLQQFAESLYHQERALIEGDPLCLEQANRQLSRLRNDTAEQAKGRLSRIQQLSDCHDIETLEGALSEAETALRLICIRAEILCGHPSPDTDQALRMEYQMSRLQDALSSDSRETPCVDSLMQLQREWLMTPFNGVFGELNERFTGLIASNVQQRSST